MGVTRRAVPELPLCPRAKSIAGDVVRSYPTGRTEFSRGFVGQVMELTVSSVEGFPAKSKVALMTTINAEKAGHWNEIAFERVSEKQFVCKVVPARTGQYSFWVRYSVDGGKTWVHDPVPDGWVLVDPPQVDAMRMYTLIPNVSGSIAEWAKELGRIKAMGFNAVHLLPLTTLDVSQSPYSAKDLFDVDPSYLDGSGKSGLEQLEAFVAEAKRLEIALCFDLVLNHVGTRSNIAQRATEWIMPDRTNPDGMRRARYWCDKGWLNWDDLVLVDYEHPSQEIREEIHAYMTEYALFWSHYANETKGFVRFDNLHSSDKRFLDTLTEKLRKEYPNIGIVAEYFTDAGTLLETVPKWGLNVVLATPWDQKFVPALREYLKYLHSISEHVRFFMPVSSHDSGTPAQEFGAVESTVPRYVAAALLGTGATGMTQGVEYGVKEKIQFIGKQPKLGFEEPSRYGAFLKKVNQILVDQPAFRMGKNCQFMDNNHHAVIAAWRKDPRPGMCGMLVICSFDIYHEHAFEVDLSGVLGTDGPVMCMDLIDERERSFAGAKVSMVLKPCSAHVLMFKGS